MITSGRRRVDRETQDEHELNIEICDQGSPKLCTTVPVIIDIVDVNDNPPVFKKKLYNFNVPAGTVGLLCRYSFLYENYPEKFFLSSTFFH